MNLDAEVSEHLVAQYKQVLEGLLIGQEWSSCDHFSGVFLPVPTKEYLDIEYRVMMVGQETKGWNGNLNRLVHAHNDGELTDYIDSATARYTKRRYQKAGRSRFLQFLNSAEKKLCLPCHSVHWANLFACDYKRRSPLKAPGFGVVKELSLQLLMQQILFLKPDAILFTTGPSYHRIMKELFEDRLLAYDRPRVVSRRNGNGRATLFSFSSGDVRCYRTTHPRYVRDNQFRDQAIRQLAEHMEARRVQSI